jgi:hypothetical protein
MVAEWGKPINSPSFVGGGEKGYHFGGEVAPTL